jgi:hypothetical protein
VAYSYGPVSYVILFLLGMAVEEYEIRGRRSHDASGVVSMSNPSYYMELTNMYLTSLKVGALRVYLYLKRSFT